MVSKILILGESALAASTVVSKIFLPINMLPTSSRKATADEVIVICSRPQKRVISFLKKINSLDSLFAPYNIIAELDPIEKAARISAKVKIWATKYSEAQAWKRVKVWAAVMLLTALIAAGTAIYISHSGNSSARAEQSFGDSPRSRYELERFGFAGSFLFLVFVLRGYFRRIKSSCVLAA